MGADFLKEKAHRERKAWRDGRNRLKQPRLDDRPLPRPMRIVPFKASPQSRLKVGESLILQIRNNRLVAYSGLAQVAQCDLIPEPVARAVASSNGMSTGKINRADNLTGEIEIAVDCGTMELVKEPH